MNENLYKLFKIQCYDLLCLREMECNGILFDTEGAREHAKRLETQCNALLREWHTILNCDVVSITSNDHLSSVLYGGSIIHDVRVAVGHYKSGAKQGQVRYRIEHIEYTFPRLVEPKPGTETKKSQTRIDKGEEEVHTQWEVNEPVLRSLKVKGIAKELLTIILEYSKLEKLRGTYLEGYSNLIEEMDWEHNILHPNYNQCVAVTGRLSSSRPNAQNMDKQTKQYMRSRYA